MALSSEDLLQVENYLSSKGIHCDDAGTTVDTADKVLAINASKAGKYYTILQLIEKAIDSGKATFYTETEVDEKVETINSNITSEKTARESADTTLQSSINSEKTARESADTTLQSTKLNTADLLDKVYPVGSIYMSLNSVSPASFIGGTWQRLASRFLYGGSELKEYTTADQDGIATHSHDITVNGHTLTVSEMPSHHHAQYVLANSGTGIWDTRHDYNADEKALDTYYQCETGSTGGNGSHSHTASSASASSLPPYQLVNMWYRTT